MWDVHGLDSGSGGGASAPTSASPAGQRSAGDASGSGRGPSGLLGVGHAAWRALSSGLARLVAEYAPVESDEEEGEGEEGGEGRGEGKEGAAGDEGMVCWQVADGVAAGHAARSAAAAAACLAVGTLAHCDARAAPPTATAASPAPAEEAGEKADGEGKGAAPAPAAAATAGAAGGAGGKAAGRVGLWGRGRGGGKAAAGRSSLEEDYEMVRALPCGVHCVEAHFLFARAGVNGTDTELLSSRVQVERSIQTWQEAHLRAPILPPLSLEDLQAMQDSGEGLS